MLPEAQLRQSLIDLKGNIARAVERMPSHQDFLDHYLGLAPAQAVPA